MGLLSDRLDKFLSTLSSNNAREAEIIKELRACGFNFWQLKSLEVKHLADILETNEHILAAIYGFNAEKDRSVIVATDMRVVYMDYIPLFRSVEEMSYGKIQGVSYSINALWSTITLHASQNDLTIHKVKPAMANRFIDLIESKTIEI